MPSMLNPSCDGGPGSGAAGRWLVRKTVAVAVRSSKGELRRGVWPAVAASTGGCVNRRHARSNCRANWGGGGAVELEVGGGVRIGAVIEGACHAPVSGGAALRGQQPQVHDAVEGQCGDLGSLVSQAEQVGGRARGVRPEKLCVGAGGGGCVRRLRAAGGAKDERAVAERHAAAVVQWSPGEGPRGGCREPAAGQAVGVGVEGAEVAARAGVVLSGESGFVHAEDGGVQGRPVWDGEGRAGRRWSLRQRALRRSNRRGRTWRRFGRSTRLPWSGRRGHGGQAGRSRGCHGGGARGGNHRQRQCPLGCRRTRPPRRGGIGGGPVSRSGAAGRGPRVGRGGGGPRCRGGRGLAPGRAPQ